MGEGEEIGIVPRFMKELFDRIDGTSDSKVRHTPLPVSPACTLTRPCHIEHLQCASELF